MVWGEKMRISRSWIILRRSGFISDSSVMDGDLPPLVAQGHRPVRRELLPAGVTISPMRKQRMSPARIGQVLDDGFEFDGKVSRSLSAIAMAVTSFLWSGQGQAPARRRPDIWALIRCASLRQG